MQRHGPWEPRSSHLAIGEVPSYSAPHGQVADAIDVEHQQQQQQQQQQQRSLKSGGGSSLPSFRKQQVAVSQSSPLLPQPLQAHHHHNTTAPPSYTQGSPSQPSAGLAQSTPHSPSCPDPFPQPPHPHPLPQQPSNRIVSAPAGSSAHMLQQPSMPNFPSHWSFNPHSPAKSHASNEHQLTAFAEDGTQNLSRSGGSSGMFHPTYQDATTDGTRWHHHGKSSAPGISTSSSSSSYWSPPSDPSSSLSFLPSSSHTPGVRGSNTTSWSNRPPTADDAMGTGLLYADGTSTALGMSGDLGGSESLHERGRSSSSLDSTSPGLASARYFGGGGNDGRFPPQYPEDRYGADDATRYAGVPSGSDHSDTATWPGPTLGGEWNTERKKRPRRKFNEIERMYTCGFRDCEKAYGTLNHLNAHVALQNHGPKRNAEEFKEIRREWRARRKDEMRARDRGEGLSSQDGSPHPRQIDGGVEDGFYGTSPRSLRLPQASISRPRGNTTTAGDATRQPLLVRPSRSASGPTPIPSLGHGVVLNSYVPQMGAFSPLSAAAPHGGGGAWPPHLQNAAAVGGMPAPSSTSPSSTSSSSSLAHLLPASANRGPMSQHLAVPLNLPGPDPNTSLMVGGPSSAHEQQQQQQSRRLEDGSGYDDGGSPSAMSMRREGWGNLSQGGGGGGQGGHGHSQYQAHRRL